ncbi:DsbA family protein [Hymenobacter taeanensis]|uniref:DsbA family protein n=1 Tax=Hymenobacter taeanensis TaxID=2735321 RepID=A0A6M6BDS3_9BACT|nr:MULTISPECIES: DsbA family protein [Hymenobacter]QJX45894.1 DsbA family protein [Hymenobacter taeanensis]UOQ79741.1 DsbA family protein [Hymenobacter sp. 5414T-23]
MITQNLPELLYISDAYCAWCYGMSPVVQRVAREFAGRITIGVLSGGMIKHDDVGPIGEVWEDIAGTLQQVEQVTGVRFGEAYKLLGQAGTYVQDSEPPARAVHAFRQLDPEGRAVAFGRDIQLALFERGQDLNVVATYEALLGPYGVRAEDFRRVFEQPATAAAVEQEFLAVGRIGVQGFPTSILRIGSQGYVLSRGYQPYEVFVQGLEQALQQATEEA